MKKHLKKINLKIDRLNESLEKIEAKIQKPIGLLTTKQTALLLQISTRTLQTYRDDGTIPFIQFGRREVRYRSTDIQQFLEEHFVKSRNGKGGIS